MTTTTIVTLAVIAVVLFFIIGVYNKLVSLRNQTKNAFAQIDVQLKRRHDLIPNLVETVKAYMSHERGTLEAVIAARNQAETIRQKASGNPSNPETMKQLLQAEGQLGAVMGRLFALSEAYPDLKANQNMANLQEELSSTENKISFARQAFNDAVLGYNTSREVFPNNVVATLFHFQAAQQWEIENVAEREAPRVAF